MSHLLALFLIALDCLTRAWRIQLASWAAGGPLSFKDALQLNLYGEAAATLTPNRLGGEAARFLGLTWSGVRPVTALVALGVEVAAEWPVFGLVAVALGIYYIPDWGQAASRWLGHNLARDLLTLEVVVLTVLVVIWGLQRLVRAGMIRHRVRRQWRVALAHVRRAPWWVVGAGALLTVVSLASRALILPALVWGHAGAPPVAVTFFGALALLASPLVVPLPSGGGGIEVAFLSGFAGDFGPGQQVIVLLMWRFYTTVLLTALGVYLLIRTQGAAAAKEVFTVGWFRRRT
ncbi:MAG TPA: lysylphosphatidylglycerol synthase transmembrane domain-containing protein [Gemmatimonadales bacterium]|nr:lysylphosphatidylglycerol synthase transmembrane domain-containing protein [Gemmatimonadales bacterium]